MTPEQLAAAEELLARRPEFAWLTGRPAQWYTASQVAEGIGVSPITVRRICERGEIPGATYYGPSVGWRLPRSGVIEWVSRALERGHGAASSGGAGL